MCNVISVSSSMQKLYLCKPVITKGILVLQNMILLLSLSLCFSLYLFLKNQKEKKKETELRNGGCQNQQAKTNWPTEPIFELADILVKHSHIERDLLITSELISQSRDPDEPFAGREEKKKGTGILELGDWNGCKRRKEMTRQRAAERTNVLIYVRTINNHHKYFGRHISRLVCQHWGPPFAILTSLITRGKGNKEKGPAGIPMDRSFHF